MSNDAGAPHVRILPQDGFQSAQDASLEEAVTAKEATIPDEKDELTRRPLADSHAIEIKDEEPDTGQLLDKIIDRKTWPAGAKVGDGTPGPGRTPYDIDERIVRAMALVGGTNGEIAAHFGCSVTVIQKRYGELINEARASRKIRLRQKQYQKALEGDTGMLIWLGKQELGQVDESRLRLGDLSRFSDEELVQISQGKIPGQLKSGKPEEE